MINATKSMVRIGLGAALALGGLVVTADASSAMSTCGAGVNGRVATAICSDPGGRYPGTQFLLTGACSPSQGPYAGAWANQVAGAKSTFTCPVGSAPVRSTLSIIFR